MTITELHNQLSALLDKHPHIAHYPVIPVDIYGDSFTELELNAVRLRGVELLIDINHDPELETDEND